MTDILRRTETSAGSVIVVMRELHWWVEVDSEFVTGNRCFENIDQAGRYFNQIAKKLKVIEVINEYTVEMESHVYFGTNPGVPIDMYSDIATDLMAAFDLK